MRGQIFNQSSLFCTADKVARWFLPLFEPEAEKGRFSAIFSIPALSTQKDAEVIGELFSRNDAYKMNIELFAFYCAESYPTVRKRRIGH